MERIKITLPDGAVREYDKGVSVYDVTRDISEGLARVALGAVVNGDTKGMQEVINEDSTFRVVKFEDKEGKAIFWHTSAHIMALAVKRLFPEVNLAIGSVNEDGFYYDFDKKGSFNKEDLTEIEEEMKRIVKEGHDLKRYELKQQEALMKIESLGESYKAEFINDLQKGELISICVLGELTDICIGAQLIDVKPIKAIKVMQVAGAYWRGNENNKMLTRIYGITFPKPKDLNDYLNMIEEAEKRNHVKLGKELGLFMQSEVVGQGLPLIKPKGTLIIKLLQRWIEDLETEWGYRQTMTPYMSKSALYKISGHWDHYREGMFHIGDPDSEDVLSLRPMTCPFQFTIYNDDQHSYRELPIRYSETSTLFRNESSGEMHGLTRIRQFTISEAHLIVRPDQLEEEFKGVVELQQYIMKVLGIEDDITYRFSKRDPKNKDKYIDNDEAWDETEQQMKKILDSLSIEYSEAEGEAAFYGPKLDIQCRNVWGKEDTIITNQIDFSLPERFDMYYVDKDGRKKRPYIIHRTSIGCYERTLATLIEKYSGAFPFWLAPIQIKVLPISDRFNEYAENISGVLKESGLRVETDYRPEKINYKIRETRLEKIPYFVVVGQKEENENTVAVTSRENGNEGPWDLDMFTKRLVNENYIKYNYHKKTGIK